MPIAAFRLAAAATLALLMAPHALAADRAPPTPTAEAPAQARQSKVKPIDINSATRAQLKTLPGIGDAEADRIVAARPYLSKASLASAKVLPEAAYFAIKDRIIAVQADPPQPKAAARPAGKS